MTQYPNIKPGPVIGIIQKHWFKLYGDKLDSVDEQELIIATDQFLQHT